MKKGKNNESSSTSTVNQTKLVHRRDPGKERAKKSPPGVKRRLTSKDWPPKLHYKGTEFNQINPWSNWYHGKLSKTTEPSADNYRGLAAQFDTDRGRQLHSKIRKRIRAHQDPCPHRVAVHMPNDVPLRSNLRGTTGGNGLLWTSHLSHWTSNLGVGRSVSRDATRQYLKCLICKQKIWNTQRNMKEWPIQRGKKNEGKRTEPQGKVGHHQCTSICITEVSGREERKSVKKD